LQASSTSRAIFGRRYLCCCARLTSNKVVPRIRSAGRKCTQVHPYTTTHWLRGTRGQNPKDMDLGFAQRVKPARPRQVGAAPGDGWMFRRHWESQSKNLEIKQHFPVTTLRSPPPGPTLATTPASIFPVVLLARPSSPLGRAILLVGPWELLWTPYPGMTLCWVSPSLVQDEFASIHKVMIKELKCGTFTRGAVRAEMDVNY